MEKNRKKNIVFSIVFLLSIAIPFPIFQFVNGGFNLNEIEAIIKENNKVSVFNAIDEDFKSKYGLKDIYLNSHNQVKYDWLEESAIPNKVVIGKDGWFFIGNGSSNVLMESLNSSKFSTEEKSIIYKKFTKNKSWLDSLQISYFTCVAPNKISIYPEYYYNGELTGSSKFEDLKTYLSEKDWDLIDLKTEILKKKDSVRLYHKSDTHWNDEGAFLGYLELMKSLKVKYPELRPVKLSSFKREEADSVGMDLSFMLGLDNVEKRIVYSKNNKQVVELDRTLKVPEGFSHEDWEYEIRYKNELGYPYKVMLVRDSFSRAWLKYLRETFQEVVLVWDWKVRREMVEDEKPDILIQAIVERDIESFLE